MMPKEEIKKLKQENIILSFTAIAVSVMLLMVVLIASSNPLIDDINKKENELEDCEIQLDYRVAGLKYVRTQLETCNYVFSYFDNKYDFKTRMDTWSNETVIEFLEGYTNTVNRWESLVYERLKDVPDLRG